MKTEKTKTLTINMDSGEDEVVVLEEVLRQVKLGNTSGVYPNWDIVEDE